MKNIWKVSKYWLFLLPVGCLLAAAVQQAGSQTKWQAANPEQARHDSASKRKPAELAPATRRQVSQQASEPFDPDDAPSLVPQTPALSGQESDPTQDKPATRNDPTQANGQLRKLLDPQRSQVQRVLQPSAARIPQITLRGRVVVKNQSAAAVIEVGGQLHTIQQNNLLNVNDSNDRNVELYISKLTATEIHIEVRPLNETILLR